MERTDWHTSGYIAGPILDITVNIPKLIEETFKNSSLHKSQKKRFAKMWKGLLLIVLCLTT